MARPRKTKAADPSGAPVPAPAPAPVPETGGEFPPVRPPEVEAEQPPVAPVVQAAPAPTPVAVQTLYRNTRKNPLAIAGAQWGPGESRPLSVALSHHPRIRHALAIGLLVAE